MNHLPDDVCRCLDAGCPEKDTCLRWTMRLGGKPARMYPYSPSLFPYDIPLGSPCPMRIAVEPDSPAQPQNGEPNER